MIHIVAAIYVIARRISVAAIQNTAGLLRHARNDEDFTRNDGSKKHIMV